jgi:hypothetical protein
LFLRLLDLFSRPLLRNRRLEYFEFAFRAHGEEALLKDMSKKETNNVRCANRILAFEFKRAEAHRTEPCRQPVEILA